MSYLAKNYNRKKISFTKGKGSYLYTSKGVKYLDFVQGIAVNCLGHAHPKLVKTIQNQSKKLWHISNAFKIPEGEKLAKKLCQKTFADYVIFQNSGAEATEASIKIARRYFYSIGKAHRLNLSAKIKTRTVPSKESFNNTAEQNNNKVKRGRRSKFKSLIIEKDFEPENPKQLEQLDENSCKWPIGHPNEKSFYFCGRTSLKDFSYCKLHLLYAYQPKGKKEDVIEKDEVPEFIGKKIKSA